MSRDHAMPPLPTTDTTRCRGCGQTDGVPVYTVAATPVTCATVFASVEEARAVPLGRVELVSCRHCGLMFNPRFDAALAEVGARYESSQAASAHFGSFARSLAKGWVKRHGLAGKTVLEIGCGHGEFLRLLRAEGIGHAEGLDPVAPAAGYDEPGFHVEARAFDAGTVSRDADAVVCRHTLEHIPDVHGFLSLLAQWARRDPARVVLFEVPATERILAEAAFWDIYYEHCSYFTAASLRHAFEAAGFEVLRDERVYGDQYLILEARAARPGALSGGTDDFTALQRECLDFGQRAREAIARCEERLDRLAAEGGPLVLWQGAAKTVGFVASLRNAGRLHSAVDLSVQRHGQFLPGHGLAVHAPQTLPTIAPRYVILMNPVYLHEVGAQLDALGVKATLLTVNDLCADGVSAGQSTTR
jgi:SAM-dependent methyltransferase